MLALREASMAYGAAHAVREASIALRPPGKSSGNVLNVDGGVPAVRTR
jgi:hypothetical protein